MQNKLFEYIIIFKIQLFRILYSESLPFNSVPMGMLGKKAASHVGHATRQGKLSLWDWWRGERVGSRNLPIYPFALTVL